MRKKRKEMKKKREVNDGESNLYIASWSSNAHNVLVCNRY